MTLIFEKIRNLLHEKYRFQYDQIQLDTDFEKELGTDSREMLELINDFEILFNIEISLDDIDDFIFSGKTITVQDVIDYIEKKDNWSQDIKH
jgi:acyl carrier protein